MAHLGNRDPHPITAEIENPYLSRLIWHEVMLADTTIGTAPMDERHVVTTFEGWNLSKPQEASFAQAFRRGRMVLQAVSYGQKYWRVDQGLVLPLVDETEFAGKHPGVIAATESLLELVLFSKAEVAPHPDDTAWQVPTIQTTATALQAMQRELGVLDTYEALMKSDDVPFLDVSAFPGVNDTTVVNAITSGQLSVGNPAQPDVQCWTYPS